MCIDYYSVNYFNQEFRTTINEFSAKMNKLEVSNLKFSTAIALHGILLVSTFTLVTTICYSGSHLKQAVPLRQWWRPFSEDPHPSGRPRIRWHNLLVTESSSYTSTITSLLLARESMTLPCQLANTTMAKLEGLPESVDGNIVFQTDILHHLTLVAHDENGERRCAGGDYFEGNFYNDYYRSRLPTVDFGNGSYGLELLVPSRFAEAFTLEIFLLFSNWHGMDMNPMDWVNRGLPVLTLELELRVGEDDPHHKTKPHFIKPCTQADFDRTTWQGRWTRNWFDPNCTADTNTKRFQCLPEEHYWCEEPWCFGPVGRLEGNGWHYSAHCSFKIFRPEEALKCLNGRWFLMWGDSNFEDTIRNLLFFILEWNLPHSRTLADFELIRNYETVFADFTEKHLYDVLFRVSQVWNAHHIEDSNGEGLATLRDKGHQDNLLAHFNGTKWPDTVIMNSGLHDGVGQTTVEEFAELVDFTIHFWMEIYKSIPADRKPRLVWRTTVAAAGPGDRHEEQCNPMKMEIFNQVVAEKLQEVKAEMPVIIVDAFDLTFPFHYNHDYSDGVHYGRPPGYVQFPLYTGDPRWYFVDIMLAHILLNALCPVL